MLIQSQTDYSQTLLHSKLNQPRLPRDLTVRTRLVEQLNDGIDRQLTLVCGPAGFGKTTLVSTWLDSMGAGQSAPASPLPAAWLSLDEKDSDLNLFLNYFIAALRTIFSEACTDTLALLRSMQKPAQATLFTTFNNDLGQLPGEFIIVIDDYHTIQGVEVHNLISELVYHWPKLLHLVLISRINPTLPLANLRAKGKINEIHAKDLRFTPQETATFLGKLRKFNVTESNLQLLQERFDGWIAGLRLVALTSGSTDSQESVMSILSSENTDITQYLLDEVLIHQLPGIYSFLLKVSILDRFCVSLCEAIIGETDPAWNVRACLDWIERSELFIIPMDNKGEWHRFHDLFQEMLQQRLSAMSEPGQIIDLHRRASFWFEAQGLIDEALRHALAAGDLDLAAHLMNAGLCDVLNHEDRVTMERWSRLLPDESIQKHPGLLMIKAWTLQFYLADRHPGTGYTADRRTVEFRSWSILTEDDLKILRGQILFFNSQQAFFSNQTALAIELCRQALSILPPSWVYVRGAVMLYLGFGLQADGQAQTAERLLLDEYQSCNEKDSTYALLLLQTLCFIYNNTGQLEKTRQIAQMISMYAASSTKAITKTWGSLFSGMVSYQWNELEDAAHHFSWVLENRPSTQITAYREAIAGMALIYQNRGEIDKAWQLVESVSQFDLERSGSEDDRTCSLRARLQFMQGDLYKAGQWADTFSGPPPDEPLLWLEEPQITRVRILVARGADADLKQALHNLDILDEIASRTHNTRHSIDLLIMRALVLEGQGKLGKANFVLKQALDLARPGGFIRVFIDQATTMHKMLQRLAEQDPSVGSIQRILAAFPEDGSNLADSGKSAKAGQLPSESRPTLAEPLTPRELEVLALLREPISNKDIALKLHISYATVKRHTINLYGKLGVNNRWDAVARSKEMGILLPE